MADSTDDLTTPSLDAVTNEVDRILDEQRRRADNIDTKCGLALAFAGAIIALTREDPRLLVVCARVVAAVAGVIALSVVFPWREPRPIRPQRLHVHLKSDPGVTRRFLLLFKGRYYRKFKNLITLKTLGLCLTLAVLAVSVTLLTLGVTLSKAKGVGP